MDYNLTAWEMFMYRFIGAIPKNKSIAILREKELRDKERKEQGRLIAISTKLTTCINQDELIENTK